MDVDHAAATEQQLMTQVMTGVDVSRRIVWISGDIDITMAHRVNVILSVLDATEGPIKIVLNSEGGEEQHGYSIYDTIAGCKNFVVIEGFGNVMSIAAAIFQAGDERFLSPHTSFMIHNGFGPEGVVKNSEIIDLAEQLKRDNSKYYEILAESSGQSIETIEGWCRTDTYFTAEEAVRHGFADGILTPSKVRPKKRKRRRKSNG